VDRRLRGAVLSPPAGRSGQKGSLQGSPSASERDAFEQEFPGLSESANATLVDLIRTGEAFAGTADRALRHHRLSRAGRQALAVIDGAGEPLSPTTIAERLLVTTASVTSLLDTLERRGLVERRADPGDRRRLLVSLTDEGSAVVDQFLPEVVALQTAAMAGLSEPQRRQLRHLLGKVRAGLAEVDPDAVAHDAPPRGAHPAT
jgi:DNA-binding MarR family transcriptional regulator